MKIKEVPRDVKAKRDAQFVLCVRDGGYPASLEIRKVYRVLPDTDALNHAMVRVVDESGEDYLYPADLFVPIELPTAAKPAFSGTT